MKTRIGSLVSTRRGSDTFDVVSVQTAKQKLSNTLHPSLTEYTIVPNAISDIADAKTNRKPGSRSAYRIVVTGRMVQRRSRSRQDRRIVLGCSQRAKHHRHVRPPGRLTEEALRVGDRGRLADHPPLTRVQDILLLVCVDGLKGFSRSRPNTV